jgi:hypothetical protein
VWAARGRGTIAGMKYKVLGFVVWQGTRWYVRRRVSSLLPSRKVAAAVIVGTTVVAAATFASVRYGNDSSATGKTG